MSDRETAAAASTFSPEPEFGLGTTVHLLPFQCSIRVRKLVVLFSKKPNAHALFFEMATTPLSVSVSVAPVAGFGLGTTRHEHARCPSLGEAATGEVDMAASGTASAPMTAEGTSAFT